MQFSVKRTYPAQQASDCLVIGVFTDGGFSVSGKQLDSASGNHLTRFFESGDLSGEIGHTLLLHDVPQVSAKRVLLVGCGKAEEFTEAVFHKVMAKAITTLKASGAKDAVIYLTDVVLKNRGVHWKIRQGIETIANVLYVFDEFKSKKKAENIQLHNVTFNVHTDEDLHEAEQASREAQAIVSGVNFTKYLGNLPSNVCTPTFMAEQAKQLAKDHGAITTMVFDRKEIKEFGMESFLAVAQGSHQPPKLIVAEYRGASAEQRPYVLVGKGITFDTGGISLKGAGGMEEMKFDMCGAASVLGTLKAIAELKLPINVVGVMPTTENMPGGGAIKPGDIVTTMSGQTVEILNTDAEGRLILCDALTYSEKFNPQAVIDIATLTGAIVITLGSVATGLMSNHEPLSSELQKAADASGDKVWPLPLWEEYNELISNNVADISNIGEGTAAKSIVAGCFLAKFAKKFHWAHLDTAGTAWDSGKNKAATGRPVPLLVQYLLSKCSG